MAIRSLVENLAPVLVLAAACGGGHQKKQPDKPVVHEAATPAKPPPPPPESEADREKKRHDQDVALVPPGACLPAMLKDQGSPRLELAAVAGDAVLCADDVDRSRLLGPVACWKVDLKHKTIAYEDPIPLPGRGFDVLMDDRCARGYCMPSDAKLPADHIAHIAWSFDKKGADDTAPVSTKVAVLAGDDVHVFDAASKVQQNAFSIRGDKGVTSDPTAIDFVADTIFVEAADASGGAVWVFKTDGTQVGPITPIGAKEKETDKPINTKGGSFSLLDHDRVAIAEQGFSQMTMYDVGTGKRTRAVRKPRALACKPAEVDTYWKGGDKVTDKCRDSIMNEVDPWVGAEAIAGKTNLLVVLRGARTGELAVVPPTSLIEDKAKLIKLPWCDAGGGSGAAPAPAGK
jgi:hypothetical protein